MVLPRYAPGCVIYINQYWSDIFEYAWHEVFGRDAIHFLAGALTDPMAISCIEDALFKTNRFSGRCVLYRFDIIFFCIAMISTAVTIYKILGNFQAPLQLN